MRPACGAKNKRGLLMFQHMRIAAIISIMLFVLILPQHAVGEESGGAGGSSELIKLSDIDYSIPDHWLKFENKGLDVDIFAVYPTVANSDDPADKPFVRLSNQQMRQAALKWLEEKAGAAAAWGNMYAPLYRQLNLAMLANTDRSDFERYTTATPREDVFAAFDYFLKNVNKNQRPFILFGHSQGAALVTECATRMLGNKEYYEYNKNHIATYAIGNAVTPKQIALNPSLKFSASRDDIGVILSWNTTSPQEVADKAYEHFGTWSPEALNTNPINWKSDETPAAAAENLASKLPQTDGSAIMVKAYADAKVDNVHKVLVTSAVPESEYEVLPLPVGKYHLFDISFFYDSIKENIAGRISAFKAKP